MKKYLWSIIMIVAVLIIFVFNNELGKNSTLITLSNFYSMAGVLPPILVLTGLLDVWVPKQIMIKYMGADAGIKGIFIALFLGSLAAGPLYVSFPIAATLIKKEARFAYVLFFIGVWSSSKLPLLLFEYTSFGGIFTAIHVITNLSIFLIGSFIIEQILGKTELDSIYEIKNI